MLSLSEVKEFKEGGFYSRLVTKNEELKTSN
jgi:hypothetical protein